MGSSECKSQCRLVKEVMDRGLCVKCGACVGLCPYFQYHDGKVVVTDQCRVEDGRCIRICPRGRSEERGLSALRRSTADPPPIGVYRKVLMARTTDPEIRKRGQYGGIVSSLSAYALEKGLVKGLIMTDAGGVESPGGTKAQSRSEILDCAGSRYSASGTLAVLNQALKKGERDLGVVGLPCQMEALARMWALMEEKGDGKAPVTLKIGLFCTWALDYRGLKAFLGREGMGGPVVKFDIPPPPSEVFRVKTSEGWKDFPLQAIRSLVQPGCALCRDMTAELADISVGTVEGKESWNTVLVRTERGQELVASAERDGFIETSQLPEENFRHLEKASKNKRKRGDKAQEEMNGSGQ